MCQFDLSWGAKCDKPVKPGERFCEEHSKVKCRECGAPAVRQCDGTFGASTFSHNLCETCKCFCERED